jgi:hypothetical protein
MRSALHRAAQRVLNSPGDGISKAADQAICNWPNHAYANCSVQTPRRAPGSKLLESQTAAALAHVQAQCIKARCAVWKHLVRLANTCCLL